MDLLTLAMAKSYADSQRLAYEEPGAVLAELELKRSGGASLGTESRFIGLEAGKMYCVTLDSGTYFAVCRSGILNDLDVRWLGNMGFKTEEYPNTGETFLITEILERMDDGYVEGTIALDAGGGTKCIVSDVAVHTIDPKFLPESGFERTGEKVLAELTPAEEPGVFTAAAFIEIEVGKQYIVELDSGRYAAEGKTFIVDGILFYCLGSEGIFLDEEPDPDLPFAYVEATIEGQGQTLGIDPAGGSKFVIYSAESVKIKPSALPEGGFGWTELGKVVLEEQAVSGVEKSNAGEYVAEVSFVLAGGSRYVVVYDGTEYLLTAYAGQGVTALGDANMEAYPFCAAYREDRSFFIFADGSEHAISIRTADEIHGIEPKYLPEGIGYKEAEELILSATLTPNEEGTQSKAEVGLAGGIPLIAGETYIVKIESGEYEAVAQTFGDVGLSLGSVSVDTADDVSILPYPFFVACVTNGEISGAVIYDGYCGSFIEVRKPEKIHPVPEAYLPGVCLPLVELETHLVVGSTAALTEAESAMLTKAVEKALPIVVKGYLAADSELSALSISLGYLGGAFTGLIAGNGYSATVLATQAEGAWSVTTSEFTE